MSNDLENFLKRSLCHAVGHARASHHSAVVTPKLLEMMDDLEKREEEGSDTQISFSSSCTFCGEQVWIMWPTVKMYLKSKEQNNEDS